MRPAEPVAAPERAGPAASPGAAASPGGGPDLAAAQAQLGRALGRARAGEDRELARKVREGGETLAHLLAGLLKMSRVHAPENRAFDAPVAELGRAVAGLVEVLGPVHLVTVEDQVYVNEVRIRTEGAGSARELGAELGKHAVGGLSFHAPLAPEHVRALVHAFADRPAERAPRSAVARALARRGLRTVDVAAPYRFRTELESELRLQDAGEAARGALRAVTDAHDHLAAGRVLNPLPLRRAVVDLLSCGLRAPAAWEALGEGLPHASHATTVALVALLVGEGAGMRGAALQDLGVTALVHDAGYVALPAAAARGPDGLARHPGEGARLLLRQRGFHVAKLRRLRGVLDHHRDPRDARGPTSPHGAVLRLAEDYATLLRLYPGRVSPASALGAIARAAGTLYDPALAQLMVNALGRFPPGTLLELEDGRCARSVSPARDAATFAAPVVRFHDPRTGELSLERHDLAHGPGVVRALPG